MPVWEFSPSELPDWAKESQAVDLRGKSIDDLRQQIETLAASIKQSTQQGHMILGAIVLELWAAAR